MASPFDAFLRRRRCVVLDGGLASELERAGHDLNDPLWSARVLMDDPAAVEAVHTDYLRAGADCITTATYQASFEGLAARGVGRADAERLMRLAVELAVRARNRLRDAGAAGGGGGRGRPLVAASIGPYGAFLADGSEYRGRYGVGPSALADFHHDRLRLLAETPADLLACETIPSFAEARVLAGLVSDVTDKPAWFTFTCRSEDRISDGAPLDEVAGWADESAAVSAVGVNCTPAGLVPAIVGALAARTSKPVVAYPNGGGAWDAATKRWSRAGGEVDWGEASRSWIAAGASVVGGCCRVGPDAIRAMRGEASGDEPGPAPRGAKRRADEAARRRTR